MRKLIVAVVVSLVLGAALPGFAVQAIPDPPPDDSDQKYFQIMIDNRVGSEHTVHLTVTANQMGLTSPDIEKITWLTGGGSNADDWTQPVFQVVNSKDGVNKNNKTVVSFKNTYDITLDKLPPDLTNQYRVLKIPFRKPDDATHSLGGSGHLTITLDKAAVMQINKGGPGGFSFALPSPDKDGSGGMTRWDFMEFNNATSAVNGRIVSFVNTTNVDFFSLGLTIKGRQADGTLATFGLDLSTDNPVQSAITALKALTGDYAQGLVTSATGDFLRFKSPGTAFGKNATALDAAIDDGFEYYKKTPLKFTVDSVPYEATVKYIPFVPGGDFIVFTKPKHHLIRKPSTLEVIESTGPLKTTAADPVQVQVMHKFVDAYLNRGVFLDTSVWATPASWYPDGKVSNEYSNVLHGRFVNKATYAFSFDDVPGNKVTSDPSISTCTSMTLVITAQ